MVINRCAGEPNEGELARFLSAFDANYEAVLAYARRRLSDPGEAEEVAAETFEVAWRRRNDAPEWGAAWLYGVAAHVIDNHRRAGRRRWRLRGKLAAQPMSLGRDPAELIGERDAVARAFAQLSEGQREVLRLVLWEGLEPHEAAIALGCSHGAFRVRLHRARAELAKHLDVDGHVGNEQATISLAKEAK